MKLNRIFVSLLVGLALAVSTRENSASAAARPIIRTDGGLVAGVAGPVEAFKGIPYAAPPVGDLRWRPPHPTKAWSGVRDAAHFGHDCMQTPYVIPSGQTASEDCLTVNVWTPRGTTAVRRPVMVFIYGGAFIGGSSAYPLYDGAKLAREGVVVVSLNYRVGVFGFLAHPGLSAESPQHVSGDYGLLDQIAALKWVRRNVAAFGGDPDRVTVFGESAGASSAAFLMTSPLAKGLFQQAIIQSVALMPLPSLAAAETAGLELGPDIGALRRMNAAHLLTLNGAFSPPPPGGASKLAFPTPTVDGYVLPLQPRIAFETGAFAAVPTIIGYNADEGRMFDAESREITAANYSAALEDRFGALAPDFLELNPAASDDDARRAIVGLIGDGMFNEGSRLIARSLSARQPRTYAYLFTKGVAGSPLPPTHSEELAFVFGSLDKPSFVEHGPPDAADWRLSATMRKAWARFAATGDPNGGNLTPWPAYEAAIDPYLDFGEVVRVGQTHRKASLDLMQRIDDALVKP